MHKFPKFYGMVTVGERGQVVIPSQARVELKIRPGDKLIVTSPPGGKTMISLMRADDFARFFSGFEKHLSSIKAEITKEGKE